MREYKIELDRYLSHISKSFDVLIWCNTCESRSVKTKEILEKHGVTLKHSIEVKLEHDTSDILVNNSTANPIITCDIKNSDLGVQSIMMELKKLVKGTSNPKIILDITSFIKPYFFRLLKGMLVFEKFTNVSITYTEPAYYSKNEKDFDPFSSGPSDVEEIPGFGSDEEVDKDKLLIVNLGFEGNRALDVFYDSSPDFTMAINGLPSYKIDYKDYSITLNDDFLREAECFDTISNASASDPFEILRILEEIYQTKSSKYKITLAPLGTKPMALGMALFALRHGDDIRIVFPIPENYEEVQPAKDNGKTWIYNID